MPTRNPAALAAALRLALRVLDETYMALASDLRREGITRHTDRIWQASPDHFDRGEPADHTDPRILRAEELILARREARKALRMEDDGDDQAAAERSKGRAQSA